MSFGLTPEGFNRKRLPDEKAEEENALIAEFGDINVQPQSVFGQFIGVMSKAFADLWEEMEDVYFSQYPSTAEGVALDYVVALNGLTRIPAQKTVVVGVADGDEGTLIPQGSIARQPSTNEEFASEEDTLITSDNAVLNTVSVDALASQSYNALINSISHFYSLPKIEFDGLFGSGDSVTVSLNGVELSAVPFNTDSQTTIDDVASAIQAEPEVDTATTRLGLVINFDIDFDSSSSIEVTINGTTLSPVVWNTDQATTMSDLAAAIQANADVTSATVTGTRELTIVPVDEGTFLVNSIVVSGSGTQAVPIDQRIDVVANSGEMVTIDYATTSGGLAPDAYVFLLEPDSINDIVAGVVSVINNSAQPVSATDNSDGTFEIEANDSAVGYSLSVSPNMTIEEVSSPVIFLAETIGVVPVPISTMTTIVTQIAGWDSITNFKAGETGRNIETDAELRLRRKNSLRILGAATVESIRARILQEVDNVTEALVFENKTMTEENLLVIFSEDFVSGNEITFTVNSVPQSTITFSSSHLNTMQLIESQLETIEGIDTVTVTGANDRELTIEMTQGYEVVINNIQIENGASKPNSTIQGGRFPKSFEAVVQGGSNSDVAEKIWETKPAGIQTFGNTSFTITDSMNVDHVINFTRPEEIYIWVKVDLTLYNEEDFPSNGVNLVEQAIVDYGETLTIGNDVLRQRVLCQIFDVTGVARGSMQIASTLNEDDSPFFGTSDISISQSQVAVFSIDRTTAVVV